MRQKSGKQYSVIIQKTLLRFAKNPPNEVVTERDSSREIDQFAFITSMTSNTDKFK